MDEKQKELHKKFPSDSWLGDKRHIEHLLEWTTFYRKNINVFIEHYMKITLHWYQIIWIFLLNTCQTSVIVAGRASAKSFTIAVFACAKCVLYPNSKVVICSGTKNQSALIVTEKIQKEILPKSKNLQREIAKFKTNKNDIEVLFKNGSSIVVVPASENARGYRSTTLIREEFRMISKYIDDSILQPFQMIRPVEFLNNPINNGFYNKDKNFKSQFEEESQNVFISSSWRTTHWMWKLITDTIADKFKYDTSCVLATDYSIALKHGIKTFNQLREAKRNADPITWRQEYENEMIKENSQAYFTYEMLEMNQRLKGKQVFYPRRTIDVLSKKKNPYSIPKQPNEIRIVSCDMAFVDNKKNDNSVFSCIRLIPESMEYESKNVDGDRIEIKHGYRRIVPYLEANRGGDVDVQAIRIKQLYEDFEADYCVLDTRNGGILVYDRLAKILYDEERDKEYQAWTCMNDDSIANRIRVQGAMPVVYAVNASQKLNSDIAISLREVLMSKRIDLIVNFQEATDYLTTKIPEYSTASDADTMVFYESPYHETQALINEMISLVYDKGESGVIKISEQGSNTKDRFTSISYGSYFASLLEQDLLSDSSDYDFCVFVN